MRIFIFLALLLSGTLSRAQNILESTRQALDSVELLQMQNKTQEAIESLKNTIYRTNSADDLAYLYAYQSGLYVSRDSLLMGKKLLDLSFEAAEKAKNNTSKAVAYRAKAYLNYHLNLPDDVVKDALTGLQYLEENNTDLTTKYYLNYLLYSTYSRWGDEEKMEKYILKCKKYAIDARDINLQVNVNNGMSSMYLARYRETRKKKLLDSTFQYLRKSFELQQSNPKEVSGDTFVITCINIANFYLEWSSEPMEVRKEKAFYYLKFAEDKLEKDEASSEKWINVLGIKSGFAKKEGNVGLAEQYLLQGLTLLMNDKGNYFKLEYRVNKELAAIALKRNDLKSALNYQERAEELLKKSFDEQQLLNAQKLEIQFETEKKDQQLKLLKERETFQKRQNYLYGGIALALLFGLVFMFVSYHFKLKYSIEREEKLKREKEESEHRANLKLKFEKEEQSRLKAEQELLNIKQQQLEKESLANSLLIEYKNDMLQQIKSNIQEGDTKKIQKLLKEEMLLAADFENIKTQIQKVHPDFFNQLNALAVKKLTPLDLKYCTYLYLKMTTKQIAQALHIEPQSVRMFKYRLKQKFGLSKDIDLDDFLANLT
ncbi:helix-turn-helix transcriptional regulator [Salegentibacter maritimus]|uniref:Regulatory protein, luxR family n=1 Tax=Salegentibacter maritimus TaxID=2794347 RepID=A0ABS0TCJ8_9FLAO|nr:hypothetical protein [Salegentibacter maritimus]MBI6118774.1 hypothetical protein [Salegentibacter maritimus]